MILYSGERFLFILRIWAYEEEKKELCVDFCFSTSKFLFQWWLFQTEFTIRNNSLEVESHSYFLWRHNILLKIAHKLPSKEPCSEPMRMMRMCSQPIMPYHPMMYQPSSVLLLSVLICTDIIVRDNYSSKIISTFCFSDRTITSLYWKKNTITYLCLSPTVENQTKKAIKNFHQYTIILEL